MCGKTTTYHQIKTYLCSIISRNPIKRDRDMRYSVIIPARGKHAIMAQNAAGENT